MMQLASTMMSEACATPPRLRNRAKVTFSSAGERPCRVMHMDGSLQKNLLAVGMIGRCGGDRVCRQRAIVTWDDMPYNPKAVSAINTSSIIDMLTQQLLLVTSRLSIGKALGS